MRAQEPDTLPHTLDTQRNAPEAGRIAPVEWRVACRDCARTQALYSGPLEDHLMAEAIEHGWTKAGHRWLCPACGPSAGGASR